MGILDSTPLAVLNHEFLTIHLGHFNCPPPSPPLHGDGKRNQTEGIIAVSVYSVLASSRASTEFLKISVYLWAGGLIILKIHGFQIIRLKTDGSGQTLSD